MNDAKHRPAESETLAEYCRSMGTTKERVVEFSGTPRRTLQDWMTTQPDRVKALVQATVCQDQH